MGVKKASLRKGYLNKDLSDGKEPDSLGGDRIFSSGFSVPPNPNHTKLIRERSLESVGIQSHPHLIRSLKKNFFLI